MTSLLCAVFFVSGASALVFETLWFHQAGLALGNSVWASSLVLSGFMGGLALGSATAVWRGDRLGPPVRAYAVLETVIAASGVALVLGLPALGALTTPLLRPFGEQPWVLNPLRLGLALVFLLVPSTAMGLTLPLLARALVALDPNFGTVLGRLYGWNTLGAVAGALLAETHLVAALGIRGSAYAAGSLNLLAAAGGWVAARSLAAGEGAATPERAPAPRWRSAGRWLGAAFLSGFALLALEVVWFRFLLLFVMGSSLSFAVMLAVVLSGIASGGLVASVWLRADPAGYRYAPLVALTAGLLCTASYAAFPAAVAPLEGGVVSGFRAVLGVSLPLMFPVSLLSGTFFTLAGAALHRGYPSAATATGVLTFANTTGAALGALAGGFLLLPLLGMEGSFFALTLLYGAIGLLVSRGVRLPRRLLWPVTGAFLLGTALFPFGAMVGRHLRTAAARWSGGEWRVVALREGVSETVLYVEELTHGKPRDLRLVTNSLSMSSTEFHIRRYMKLYVYLPVAIHPDPRRALLVSYGVGSTAKALTETRSLEEIDVVDISKDVLAMSSVVFPDPGDNPLHDPRVTVHVEDGRYFMRTTEKTFDLITGEPPPPQIANVVNLYTREYFALMRDRLREGGFVTYWLPLHSLSDRSAKAIVRAFLEVFPDASLWHAWREDVMLVGSRNATGPVTEARFRGQWDEPRVAAEMKALGLETPEQLGALFIGDADYLREMSAGEPPLVDDFPKRILQDSIAGPGASALFASLSDTDAARERFLRSALVERLWPETAAERTLPWFRLQAIVNALIGLGGHPLDKSPDDLHAVLTATPLTAPVLWHLGSTSDLQGIVDTLTPEERSLPFWQYQLAAGLVSERAFEEALEPLRASEAIPRQLPTARILRIYLLCVLERREEARELARATWELLRNRPPVDVWWDFLARTCAVDPRGA